VLRDKLQPTKIGSLHASSTKIKSPFLQNAGIAEQTVDAPSE
jgi:hypothetical protein